MTLVWSRNDGKVLKKLSFFKDVFWWNKRIQNFQFSITQKLGQSFYIPKNRKKSNLFSGHYGPSNLQFCFTKFCTILDKTFVQDCIKYFSTFSPVFSPPQVKRNCNRDHIIFELYDVSAQIRFSTSKPRLVKCSTGNLIYELSNDLRLSLEEIRKS